MQTSGFPVEITRTKDDFPTLGAPTRQRVGVSRSTTGIARKVYKAQMKHGLSDMFQLQHISTNIGFWKTMKRQ